MSSCNVEALTMERFSHASSFSFQWLLLWSLAAVNLSFSSLSIASLSVFYLLIIFPSSDRFFFVLLSFPISSSFYTLWSLMPRMSFDLTARSLFPFHHHCLPEFPSFDRLLVEWECCWMVKREETDGFLALNDFGIACLYFPFPSCISDLTLWA